MNQNKSLNKVNNRALVREIKHILSKTNEEEVSLVKTICNDKVTYSMQNYKNKCCSIMTIGSDTYGRLISSIICENEVLDTVTEVNYYDKGGYVVLVKDPYNSELLSREEYN